MILSQRVHLCTQAFMRRTRDCPAHLFLGPSEYQELRELCLKLAYQKCEPVSTKEMYAGMFIEHLRDDGLFVGIITKDDHQAAIEAAQADYVGRKVR